MESALELLNLFPWLSRRCARMGERLAELVAAAASMARRAAISMLRLAHQREVNEIIKRTTVVDPALRALLGFCFNNSTSSHAAWAAAACPFVTGGTGGSASGHAGAFPPPGQWPPRNGYATPAPPAQARYPPAFNGGGQYCAAPSPHALHLVAAAGSLVNVQSGNPFAGPSPLARLRPPAAPLSPPGRPMPAATRSARPDRLIAVAAAESDDRQFCARRVAASSQRNLRASARAPGCLLCSMLSA